MILWGDYLTLGSLFSDEFKIYFLVFQTKVLVRNGLGSKYRSKAEKSFALVHLNVTLYFHTNEKKLYGSTIEHSWLT